MGRRVRLRRVSLLLLVPLVLALAAPETAQQQRGSPAVTGAVQVTSNPEPVRAHSSPQIAVNPTNGELVVVESDVRGSRSCSVHISVDEGRSWFRGGDPMVEPFSDCGFYAEYGPYATMAFARDGTLYVAFVASEFLNRARDATPRHVFLARSEDGGRSFATAKVYEAPDGNPDLGLNKGPMLAVDPTDPQRVYVGWRQGVFRDAKEKLKSNIAASGDGGQSFGPPVDLTDERGGDYPGIAVDGRGVVHAVYWTRVFPPTPSDQPGPVRPIMYRHSPDKGTTWSEPVEVDPGNQAASRPALLAADPTSDTLYVVWHGNAEPNNQAPDFQGDLDIFVRTSHDAGRSWSERVQVNEDRGQANQYEPGISIGPGGRVDIAWYDFRDSPVPPITSSGHSGDTGLSDIYYSWSTDGGRTFRPNIRVSDRSIDRSVGVWSNDIDSKFNIGIASTRDTVYVAWQDTRNAIRDTHAEDAYVASVRLGAVAPASASRRDVPLWILLASGAALGMGIAAVLAWILTRRATTRTLTAPVK
ncbi:MAG: glycoside hydrolase [Actinomycetota bacterium]|nr:glycoside hydrolase [Actinomycetota bacterium]